MQVLKSWSASCALQSYHSLQLYFPHFSWLLLMDFLIAFPDNLAFFFFPRSFNQGYTTVLSELDLGSSQLITGEDYLENLKSLAQESHKSLRWLSLRVIFIPHKAQIRGSFQFMLGFMAKKERWVHKTKSRSEFSLWFRFEGISSSCCLRGFIFFDQQDKQLVVFLTPVPVAVWS